MINRFAKVNNLELWYETFGDKKAPAILLIMGAGAQGVFWPDKFCEQLADMNHYVIRYDHRDTGMSTTVDFTINPYDLNTLADDAMGLLKNLNIEQAHIIGTSMGGYIAQLLAIHNPAKVLSLTLIASTTDLSVLADVVNKRDLTKNPMEPPFPEVITMLQEGCQSEVESWRILNGKAAKFDEAFYQELSSLGAKRAKNPLAAGNHLKAIDRTEFNLKPLLNKLIIPTVVIHGAADPILPLSHGQSIANTIPNSKFITIEKMGHMLSVEFLTEIIKFLPYA
jgi:pimeloyl-ACP methyl ester carboxylesterase